jgi:short-subunit dehydrogenase
MPGHSRKRTVLITGASTGLGLAIAREFLKDPTVHVILTARESSLARFDEVGLAEGQNIWLRPLDVTNDAQRRAVVEEIECAFGAVDTLINNAGITYRTVAEYATSAELSHQMAVNYEGPMALCALVLPAMRRQREGRILQISSASGLSAMPTMGLYSASKFALEGASESMHFEVRPFGVHVSLIIAGFINSKGYENSVVGALSTIATIDEHDCYHPHFHHMNKLIGRMMHVTWSSSDSVAKRVVATARSSRPPLRVLATWDARLLWWFRRFIPQVIFAWVTYRLLPGVSGWVGDVSDTAAPDSEPIETLHRVG